MKYENKLLTITLSIISFFLFSAIISYTLYYLEIQYSVSYFFAAVLAICFLFSVPLIIGLIYYTVRYFNIKKGLFIRYKGKMQRIGLNQWDIGGKEVNLNTLNLSNHKTLDFAKVDGDLSTVQALKIIHEERLVPKSITNLELLSNLKVLEINSGGYEMILDLTGLKRLNELEVLILNLKSIAKITSLDNLSKLQVLDLSRNKIKEIEGLENLKNLKVLNLSYNEIPQIYGLDSLQKLEKLYLEYNQIGDIKNLKTLTNLKELILSNNSIIEIQNLEGLVSLENLDLRDNKISKIKSLGDLKKLTWFSLDDNPVYKRAKKQFDTTKTFRPKNVFETISIFKNPQDLVTYCWRNEKAKDEAIEYIRRLPSIYDDITLNELESKTKLEVNELRPIIEELIFTDQIKAKITSDVIYFGKKKIVPSVPLKNKEIPQIPKVDLLVRKNSSKIQLKVFLSYSTLDSLYFQISDVAKALESYPEIEKILYWEADSSGNIVEFMERTLKDCSVFILFCSENAFKSQAVVDEWQAAFQLRKKGLLKFVPVYDDEKFIPALLTPLLNVKFSKDKFIDFVLNLRQEILRK